MDENNKVKDSSKSYSEEIDFFYYKQKEYHTSIVEKNRIESLYLVGRDEDIRDKVIRNLKEAEEKLISSGRIEKKDVKFFSKTYENVLNKRYYYIENFQFENYLFVRAIATDFIFRNINFSKTIFDGCYLKDCRFIRCTFEGAKFMNCNLQGAYYEDCNFNYVIFEKTFVDDEIFGCAPKKDNLKYKFARSLKLNYASIGDYVRASKAVTIELEATKSHLKDSWISGDEWYKKKYGGLQRKLYQFWKWTKVSILDFVWGNGESLWRLIRFNFCIFLALTFYHVLEKSISNIWDILPLFFIEIPANYLGIPIIAKCGANLFEYYPGWLNLLLVISRMICFGLLMSIIIKKYNRR